MRPTRVLALAGLSMTMLGTAAAEIESEFHVGYSTDYIFRGVDLGTELFEFGFDFAGDTDAFGGLGWSAGIWYGSFDTAMGGAGSNELDVFAEVSKALAENVSIAAGVTHYSYFGNGGLGLDDDIEPYVSLGVDVLGLSFGATAYYDASDNYARDFYYELTAAYERELMANVVLGLEGLAAYYDDTSALVQTDVDDWYFGLTASLSIALSDNISLSPYVAATWADEDYVFGGVSLGFGF